MANFRSPNLTALGQAFPGQIITGSNSTIPMTTVPTPGLAGPHIRFINPVGVPQMAAGAPVITGFAWGAGVVPVANQVPVAAAPPQSWMAAGQVHPQIQIQSTNQVAAEGQTGQLESPESPTGDEIKHEHKRKHRHKREHKHSHREDRHREKKRHHKTETGEDPSHDKDEKKKHRSRHRRDETSDEKSSKSGHHRKKRHSSGSRRKEKSEKRSRGAVLIEDRDEVDVETGIHGAVLLEDRNESRNERGAHGAVLLDDRDDGTSERGIHGAVLIEDRDDSRVETGAHGAVLLEDRDEFEEGEIELRSDFEDGEIYDDDPTETIYSDDQYFEEAGREREKNEKYGKERHDRRDGRQYSDLDLSLDVKPRVREQVRGSSRGEVDRNDGYRPQKRDERFRDSRSPEWRDKRSRQKITQHDRYDGDEVLRRARNDSLEYDGQKRKGYKTLSGLEDERRFSEKMANKNVRVSRNTGAILIEDRDESPKTTLERGRPMRHSSAVLIEDGLQCGDGRASPKLIDDRREARGQENRNQRLEQPRGKGLGTDRPNSGKGVLSKNHQSEGKIDTKVGRTGAILIEDRDNPKGDTRLEISRTGAVLLEDRDVGRTFDRGQRGPNTSINFQGNRGQQQRTDSRANATRYQQDLAPAISRNKRSRSNSLSRQDVRMKQEPVSAFKKRKVWEPAPNDVSVTKCIRSLSPVVPGDNDDLDTDPIAAWVRCSAADLYFTKDPKTGNMVTTKRMRDLEERVDRELVQRAAMVRAHQEPYEKEPQRPNWKHRCTKHAHHSDDSDSEHERSSSSSSDSESDQEELWLDELKFKQQNPYRLDSEIWYNEPNELNYGPLCRCSLKAKQFGIRHSIYPGEKPLPQCDLNSSNLDKLYHYRVTVSPAKNFIISRPTVIMFDGHEYLFEGFSIFSHKPIPKLPECQVVRFNIIYTIHVVEEQVPENFSVQSLDTFAEYLFDEILELVDMDWRGPGDEGHCRRFHVMPRFARPFPENGKELLSMNDVLLYLLKASKPLLEPSELKDMYELDNENWTKYVDSFRHMVVTCPGKRPSSIRIDQLDRSDCYLKKGPLKMPFIIHHGLRPPQLSYAGDPMYKKKWREYMKFRHLLWSRARVSEKEREKLNELEAELEKIRMKCTMKREITVAVSSKGFLKTGIRADICQHAMLLPVLFEHLRFHECLSALEKSIGYHFKDRSLLQLAMTHSSYKTNYGTNPDHGRNSLSNCGFRQLEFGDHKLITQHTRKRGLNVLLRIMAKMGHKDEKRSEIPHNERLEFLGDAVVEFVTSTHLYNMFPQASEGELTLYRGCLVNNNQLSVLANNLRLQEYLLYAHGPDLCHDSHLKHAMANCFEALMGALFLDGGIKEADRVFATTCFPEGDLLNAWANTPKHPLIADEPNGDRHWIAQSHVLQKLAGFEDDIGYEFKHIRLLARAFTQRNVGYNNLTYGHNQRLEFLGDTIMQLICSEYLFKHFPDHHEGHLTLLRSSLVNNKTQSTVATELGMQDYVIKANMTKVDEKAQNNSDMKTKEKADLLEALYGALYVDGGLEPCQILTDVCFFPRLEDFILDQEWNDPKSQLQQCCLTLRELNDESPDIPVYKVIGKYGPTNQRRYTIAVYFREKRLAVGTAGSKQQAEMVAADLALRNSKDLFNKNVYPVAKVKSRQMVTVKEEPKDSSN